MIQGFNRAAQTHANLFDSVPCVALSKIRMVCAKRATSIRRSLLCVRLGGHRHSVAQFASIKFGIERSIERKFQLVSYKLICLVKCILSITLLTAQLSHLLSENGNIDLRLVFFLVWRRSGVRRRCYASIVNMSLGAMLKKCRRARLIHPSSKCPR